MSHAKLQKIIIIGYGKVTEKALQYVFKKQEMYDYDVCYVEHEPHPFNNAIKFCNENYILYQTIYDKSELTDTLLQLTNRTLIISASNQFLFPKELINKDNITIINSHNALNLKYIEEAFGRKGCLDSLDYFYELVSNLKAINRKLITNFYVEKSQFIESISKGEVTYEYNDKNFLNIIIQDDGFSRLYYYVADVDSYQFYGAADTVYVCDVFSQKQYDKLDKITQSICDDGFKQYASYHKWTCKEPRRDHKESGENIKVVQEATDEAIRTLFQCFDKYSDYLPRQNKLTNFIEEKGFICAYNMANDDFLGGLVFTEKERTVTEEFVFVVPEKRGRKLSNLLHGYWYDLFAGINTQYIAWIRDDNVQSIALHQRYDYRKGKMRKITYLKG